MLDEGLELPYSNTDTRSQLLCAARLRRRSHGERDERVCRARSTARRAVQAEEAEPTARASEAEPPEAKGWPREHEKRR